MKKIIINNNNTTSLFKNFIFDKQQDPLTMFNCIIEQNDISQKEFIASLYDLWHGSNFFIFRVLWIVVKDCKYYITLILSFNAFKFDNLSRLHEFYVLANYIDMNNWKFNLCTWGIEDYSNPLKNPKYFKFLSISHLFEHCYWDCNGLNFRPWFKLLFDQELVHYVYESLHTGNYTTIGSNICIWRPYLLELLKNPNFHYFKTITHLEEVIYKSKLFFEHFKVIKSYSNYSKFKTYWLYKQKSNRSIIHIRLNSFLYKMDQACLIYDCELLSVNVCINPSIHPRKIYNLFKRYLRNIYGLEHILIYKKEFDLNYTSFILLRTGQRKKILNILCNVQEIQFLVDFSTTFQDEDSTAEINVVMNSIIYCVYTRKAELASIINNAFLYAFESIYDTLDCILGSPKEKFKSYLNDENDPMCSLFYDYNFLENLDVCDFTFIPSYRALSNIEKKT